MTRTGMPKVSISVSDATQNSAASSSRGVVRMRAHSAAISAPLRLIRAGSALPTGCGITAKGRLKCPSPRATTRASGVNAMLQIVAVGMPRSSSAAASRAVHGAEDPQWTTSVITASQERASSGIKGAPLAGNCLSHNRVSLTPNCCLSTVPMALATSENSLPLSSSAMRAPRRDCRRGASCLGGDRVGRPDCGSRCAVLGVGSCASPGYNIGGVARIIGSAPGARKHGYSEWLYECNVGGRQADHR